MNLENYSDNTPIQITFGEGLSYRKLWYRIEPTALPFWKRLFGNPWQMLRRASFGTWDYYFDAHEYNSKFSKFKTLGEIREYNKTQKMYFDNYVKAHGVQMWPDEKR